MNDANGFDRRPLKRVATINDEALGDNTDPDFELKYVDIGNVDSTGQILEIATYRFEDAPSRARRIVRDGDVIISTVRTYLQSIAPIQSPPDNLIVSTGFAVVRPQPRLLDAGFCRYTLREPQFIHEVIGRSVGITYPAISASELGAIPIYVPPLTAQRAIADYLDHETAGIDAMIAAKEHLLELLSEKRRALIANTVRQGLNPGTPVRDSGVEWLGKIPAHWKTDFARWLFREVEELSATGDEELLTVSHLTGVTSRSEKDVNMFMAESMEGYKVCHAGDLVINTLWAWMGAMGVAFQHGIVSPAYNVYRSLGQHNPQYVDYLVRVRIFAQEVTRYSKGVWTSRLRLYPEGFFQVQLPVPPLEEQQAIVDYLKQETARLDNLAAAAQKTIALLRERRAALIAAAVTGQIKVTE